MVQTKLIATFAAALAVCACSTPRMTWHSTVMDGSRAGTVALTGTDVAAAMGTVQADGSYKAPNGKVYKGGSTPAVAEEIISRQPALAPLKAVIGYSPKAMTKTKKAFEFELGNWSADALRAGVEKETGRKVDFAVINRGGIRIDMPEGPVMIEDIESMFPFKNYLVYLELKGSDLRKKIEGMAQHGGIQPISGCRVVVDGREVKSIEIGGQPLDDNKTYGIGTIDFLMRGGDGISMAENASNIITTDCKLGDWMVEYVSSLQAEGKPVAAEIDGRITMTR